ncbi:MAG: hypothetical protein CMA11_06665 [Euryarchaeota archaeon]|nr:hypothetical protein [Euryarchaeota archaeon]|tara:strand:- start:3162 stop:4274 length:1113 start_codon:yes stop_codon:yes gene_type:complete
MEDLPPIPNGEIENDFDFIKKITTVSTAILMVALLWYGYLILTGEISLTGPSPILTERESDYDSLIQFDDDDLSGNGVSVCIVDSGIDMNHGDLNSIELSGWSDFIGGQSSPYDDNGHGTAMAGILVADGGLSGLTRDIDLYVAKALSGNGEGDDTTVAEAIDWCVTSNVDIISLSLGGSTSGFSVILGDAVEDSVDAAYDAGIVVVAAAGNDGGDNDDGDVASPGSVNSVICVGGVDINGNLWVNSSIGDNNGDLFSLLLPRNSPDEKPEVVAPAHNVPVLLVGDACEDSDYCWGLSSGTSAATVFVTGAVAMLFDKYPDLMDGGTDMLDNLKQWIADSSKKRSGQENHDDQYGYGLLQIEDLIERSQA